MPPTLKDPAISIWQYLAATVLPILFIAASLFFLVQYLEEQQRRITMKIEGAGAISFLHEEMLALQRLRGLSEIFSQSDDILTEEIVSLRERVFFTTASQQGQEHLAGLGLATEMNMLKERTEQLFQASSSEDSPARFAAYTELIREVLRLINVVGASSQLMLDAGEKSFHLTDLLMNHLPEVMEAAGRLRGIGSRLLVSGGWSLREELILREHLAALEAHLEGLENDLASITKIDPQLRNVLLPVRNNKEMTRFLTLSKRMIERNSPRLEAREYFAIGSAAIEGYCEPQRQMTTLLIASLTERRESLQRLKVYTTVGFLLAILLLVYFSTAFYRSNRAAFRRIEELAITDMLTGLYNRRYLGLVIGQELLRAKRAGKSFTLAVLDIDYFKKYNDHYGHQAGDEVLSRVAAAMQGCLQRAGDFLFRIGGEEFCFFFAGGTETEAMAMAERVREAVAGLAIEHVDSPTAPFVTISAGLVFLPEVKGTDFDPLMKLADDTLYQAKEMGRNRCRFVAPVINQANHIDHPHPEPSPRGSGD